MKTLGVVCIILGLLLAYNALTFDTTTNVRDAVPAELRRYIRSDMRVHNLGLLLQKNQVFIWSAALFLGGIVLFSTGVLTGSTREKKEPKEQEEEQGEDSGTSREHFDNDVDRLIQRIKRL
jgi:hypothetical protein